MEKYRNINMDVVKSYFERRFEELRARLESNPPPGQITIDIKWISSGKLTVSKKCYVEDEIDDCEIYALHYIESCTTAIDLLKQHDFGEKRAIELMDNFKRHLRIAKNRLKLVEEEIEKYSK
jgi:hypothetical protein